MQMNHILRPLSFLIKKLRFRTGVIGVTLLSLVVSNLSGQNIDAKTPALNLPRKFLVPTQGVEETLPSNDYSTSMWTVYSDRRENQTFTTPTSGKGKKVADFLEPFVVIGEQDGYYHIVKSTPTVRQAIMQDSRHYVPRDAEDYGWIRKERLLRWNHCLVSKTQKDSFESTCCGN
jgi:hypothetical protein